MFEWAYVNTIDAKRGMVTVKYAAKESISSFMPYFAFGNEYLMPNIGDKVVVLKTGKGASDGAVLGPCYNEVRVPKAQSGFYKDTLDGTYIKQQGSILTFRDSGGEISVTVIISTLSDHEQRISSLEERVEALESRVSALGG